MGALPKRKVSKGRRDRRRSHQALPPTNMIPCPQCHKFYLPHHVCPYCGSYKGAKVVEIKVKKKKKA